MTAPDPQLRRLRRANLVAAMAFTIGGLLFALGAAEAQLGSGDATTAASIYLAGGIFFTTGGYASMLGPVNERQGGDSATGWHWWSFEPGRDTWLSPFVLFIGTLAFGISLIDAFVSSLGTAGVDRLIWRPEIAGCVLFLLSGHLGFVAICQRFRPCLRPHDLGWWIVAVNQLGSILFMVSAIAAFTRPETANEVNVTIANWGTLTGALCFAVGGVMQAFDRPAAGTGP